MGTSGSIFTLRTRFQNIAIVILRQSWLAGQVLMLLSFEQLGVLTIELADLTTLNWVVAGINSVVVAAVFGTLASAFVTPIVTSRLRRGEQMQLHDQSRELESVKSQLALVQAKQNIKYNLLQEKRIEAALELSSLVAQLEQSIFVWTENVTHGSPTPVCRSELNAAALGRLLCLRRRASELAVLFPDECVRSFEALNDEFGKLYTRTLVYGENPTIDDRTALMKTDRTQLRRLMHETHDSLRGFIGVIESP